MGQWPSYIVDLVAYNVTDPQRHQLRLSTTKAAVVRRTRPEFGKRAFSICGPDVWNSLPVAVRNTEITQHSDEHSSRICSLCFFLVTVSIHSADFVMQALFFIVGLGTITLCCIVLYCIVIGDGPCPSVIYKTFERHFSTLNARKIIAAQRSNTHTQKLFRHFPLFSAVLRKYSDSRTEQHWPNSALAEQTGPSLWNLLQCMQQDEAAAVADIVANASGQLPAAKRQ